MKNLFLALLLLSQSALGSYIGGGGSSGGGGVTTIGTFSGTSIANGASISGSTLTLGVGDGTNPGLISTTTQTIAGHKSFSGLVTFTGSAPNITMDNSGNFLGFYPTSGTNAGEYLFYVDTGKSIGFFVSPGTSTTGSEVQTQGFGGWYESSAITNGTSLGGRGSAAGTTTGSIRQFFDAYARTFNAQEGSTATYGYSFSDGSAKANNYSTYRLFMPSTTSIGIQSNGVTAISIDSSGDVTLGAGSATPTHVLNTLTAAATNCGTTPAACIQITINGTTHYIPYY